MEALAKCGAHVIALSRTQEDLDSIKSEVICKAWRQPRLAEADRGEGLYKEWGQRSKAKAKM